MNEWISVKDRLPEYTVKYLVWVGVNEAGAGMYPDYRTALWHYVDKRWYVDHNSTYELIGDVAYWMPLPLPPE